MSLEMAPVAMESMMGFAKGMQAARMAMLVCREVKRQGWKRRRLISAFGSFREVATWRI